MPDYDDHPIEGYIHNEPTGRPRPGARYRSPSGDSRILKSMVGLFLAAGVAIMAFSLASLLRTPPLAERALGENPVECRPDQLTDRWTFKLNTRAMIDHYPEVQNAAGLRAVVEAYSTGPYELITTEQVVLDLRTVDWKADELPLEIRLPKGPGANNFINLCKVELTTVADAGDLPPPAPDENARGSDQAKCAAGKNRTCDARFRNTRHLAGTRPHSPPVEVGVGW